MENLKKFAARIMQKSPSSFLSFKSVSLDDISFSNSVISDFLLSLAMIMYFNAMPIQDLSL
jgi:hypothetical protein